MNRITKSIISRLSVEGDADGYLSKSKNRPKKQPSCWTRFMTRMSSFCHCIFDWICFTTVKMKGQQLKLPGSMSEIKDKDLHIIKTANLPIIWIMSGLGAPTEALVERLAQFYNFHHIIVGNMLQSEISVGTNSAELAKKLMERGVVIPKRFLNEMIKKNMAKAVTAKGVKGFLFSDYPTTFTQAKAFMKTISAVDYIMVLKFDDNTVKLCAYNQLLQQTHSSKNVCKSKSDLKISMDELLNKYHSDLRHLYKMVGNKMQIVDSELPIPEVCKLIMKWIDRAMVFHELRPVKSVEVLVRAGEVLD